jgi:predicted ATPase/DNA-binding XRE family transcriptional regulator
LSQEELAERAHLTTHAVSALERGTRTRPYPNTVRSLADALGASDTEREALFAAVPSRQAAVVQSRPASDAAPVARFPVPATPLVARDDEVARVSALVRDPAQRLVTLTGTGGVGKTRVGIAVASAVQSAFRDGARFVPLAPILDVALVLPTVADRLGVAIVEGRDARTALVEHLHGRDLLLVLDNFEHVVGAAPYVAELIEACPGVTVLVTSRAALRMRGETEVAVAPLGLPLGTHPGVEAVAASPAGELFIARARAVSPAGELNRSDAAAIARICRRLAGIPLAIELAAARTRFLDPPTLLARLDDAIAPDGARDLPARQRTMRAALDWSYELLHPDERALLRLLSIFSGGFSIDAAESVAELAGTVRRGDVLERLGCLCEQSLVVSANGTGERRYDLLEPVAQYARVMLAREGEATTVGDAHTAHFLALAERAEPEYQRAEQVHWLATVDAEHTNMTAAIERALAAGDADTAGRTGCALSLNWWLRGHLLHGRRLLEAALALPMTDEIRTRTEIAAATMAFAQSDVPASRRWWQSAGERARVTGDLLAQANCTAGVGLTALATDDLSEAGQQFEQAAQLAEAAGPQGEWAGALTQIWLGTVYLLERGLASARRRGDRLSIYIGLYNLSQVAASQGDLALSRAHLEEGIRLSLETRDLANLAYFLDALAVVEATGGSYTRVPVLQGAVQGIREAIDSVGYGYYRPDVESGRRAAAQARLHLGADRYDDALDSGRALEPVDAVALALAPPPSDG